MLKIIEIDEKKFIEEKKNKKEYYIKFNKENQIKKKNNKKTKKYLGQENIVKEIINYNKINKISTNKRMKSFYLYGESGSGKTALAEYISSKLFENKIFRINCNEITDKFLFTNLLGAPKGYLGSDSPTKLEIFIQENIKNGGVILFDEIDKSVEEIKNLIMQWLDKSIYQGMNTDYELYNFILFATSNEKMNNTNIGFKNNLNEKNDVKESENFKKEISSRFTKFFEIVNKLNLTDVKKIIRHEINNYDIEKTNKNEIYKKITNEKGIMNIKNLRNLNNKIESEIIKYL